MSGPARGDATILLSEHAQALAILRREHDRYALSRWAEIAYRLLRAAVSGFTLAYLAMLCVFLLVETERRDWVHSVLMVVVGIGAASVLSAALLFLLNVPTVIKMTRQRLELRRLGYGRASASLWRRRKKASLGSSVWSWLVVAVGVFVCVALVAHDPTAWHHWAWALLIGMPVLGQHFVRRAKRWHEALEDIDALSAEIDRAPAGEQSTGSVSVSGKALDAVARIEAVQIVRDRLEAIRDARHEMAGYAIVTAPQATAGRAALSSEQQQALQELLERLSADPRAGAARPEPGGTLWRVRSGAVELGYSVDDTLRLIRLETVEGDAEAAPGRGAGRS